MAKILDGNELADFIKERQAHQVRGLRQHDKIRPRLAIVVTSDNPVIGTYVRLKQAYAQDILIETDVFRVDVDRAAAKITELNDDQLVTGIIVQLPLSDPALTDQLVNLISPAKDVDGLGQNSQFDPATAVAINWLLTGYNIELTGRKIVIVGRGRLVGAPLAAMWQQSGYDVTVLGRNADLKSALAQAEIIVSATGVPGLLTDDLIPPGAVVVDAGTADDSGVVVGDVAPDLRERDDITITPAKGGVGPLTIAALMDNLIRAARGSIAHH
jgi:methylenetetrahydrofolate dehydrogenase (NADP+)/methenyltetrahydrofolate cyclohydrolase